MEAVIKKQIHQKNYIDRFWENLLKAGKDKLTYTYLKARLELLETYWSKFLGTHGILLEFEDLDESDYIKLDLFSSTEENYLHAKSRLMSQLEKDGASPKYTTSSADPSDAGNIIKQIQLLKIKLPIFSSDQLSWEGFRDLFRSLVHDVEGLAPIQKLQYLKASLSGEAAAAVANIEMSSAGYTSAWEELASRYDNKRVLLATYMRAMLSTPTVTKASACEIKRLIMVMNQASRSFRTLGRPVDHWDDWFVHLLVEKLDSSIRLLWESSLSFSQPFPRFEELLEFLQTRVRALEAAGSKLPQITPLQAGKARNFRRKDDIASHATAASSDTSNYRKSCPLCREQHSIRSCAKFKTFTPEQRRDCVRKKRACYNCLGLNHSVSSCPSTNRCRHCQENHHTLLHGSNEVPARAATTAYTDSTGSGATSNTESQTPAASDTRVAALASATKGLVLLATAQIVLIGEAGLSVTIRALLDSGSEASFITECTAQLLRLPRRRVNVAVSGLQGVSTGTAMHAVSLMIGTHKSPSLRIALPRVLVLSKLTAMTPGKRVVKGDWPHLDGLSLADPDFDKPSAVDAVLGADAYGMILANGLRRGPLGTPNAHLTIFGWVLMGSLINSQEATEPHISVHHAATQSNIHEDIRKLWELEDIPTERIFTPEESHCEKLFLETHYRDIQGRYVVRLPRRENASDTLGDSRLGALRMLQS